jgi:Cu+-exporting ATPase
MKYIFFSIILVVILVIGVMVFSAPGKSQGGEPTKNNVTIVDGKQIIEITAKGGFTPRKSVAKAGIVTILRINTNGTFDCSSIVRIPSMNISRNLPQSGVTDIDIGSPQVGVINGTCGMGMYPFDIQFQN